MVFEQYMDSINKIMLLSKDRMKYIGNNKSKSSVIDFSEISEENKEYDEITSKITNICYEQGYEFVKILQTIMYLGRDEDYDNSLTPDEIYQTDRDYMDNIIGWSDIEVDTSQMTNKPQMYDYLKKGFNILEINV